MNKGKKWPVDLLVMGIGTLLVCFCGALSTMGVFDGTLFPLEWDMLGAELLAGIWGFFVVLILTLPVWFVYGYVRIAVLLYQKGKKTAFLLWLVLVALLAVVIIGLIAFAIYLSHRAI